MSEVPMYPPTAAEREGDKSNLRKVEADARLDPRGEQVKVALPPAVQSVFVCVREREREGEREGEKERERQ